MLSLVLFITLWGTAPLAQTGAAAPIFAQKLVDEVAARHPELNSLGLHVTPPDSLDNIIIASSVRGKIGKQSDDLDLDVIRTGKSSAEKRDQRKITDVKLPLTDKNGIVIGMVVMEIKYSYTTQESVALERAQTVLEELRKQVPSKAKLFKPIGASAVH